MKIGPLSILSVMGLFFTLAQIDGKESQKDSKIQLLEKRSCYGGQRIQNTCS